MKVTRRTRWRLRTPRATDKGTTRIIVDWIIVDQRTGLRPCSTGPLACSNQCSRSDVATASVALLPPTTAPRMLAAYAAAPQPRRQPRHHAHRHPATHSPPLSATARSPQPPARVFAPALAHVRARFAPWPLGAVDLPAPPPCTITAPPPSTSPAPPLPGPVRRPKAPRREVTAGRFNITPTGEDSISFGSSQACPM